MLSVEPHCHEFDANFIFDGLDAFFAADRRVKDGGGSVEGEFHADGERWVARLSYQSSNLLPPESGQLPSGREFSLETIREFRLMVKRSQAEDEIGEQSFSVHLAPRWRGMRAEDRHGDVIHRSVPKQITEAVNIRVQGSNVDFFRYLKLLQRAFYAVGLNESYVSTDRLLPISNVQDASREVRVHEDASGAVHALDGPIAKMYHVLESDRGGYRKLVQDDRKRPGHYVTVTLGPERVRELIPSSSAPVEVKHYYGLEPSAVPDGHPLSHPKVCVSLQNSRWNGTVTWAEEHTEGRDGPAISLETLVDELDAMLRAVLADADLDLAPSEDHPGPGDRGPFVRDAYWAAEVTKGWDGPVRLNLTELREEQGSVVIRHVADGLSPVQWESLETLVADGGELAPADIAEENGRHVGSVRRALRDMERLVHRKYGEVSLRSRHVAEHVHDAVREAREATRRAVETTAKAMESAERNVDAASSAFTAWASRHGIDHDSSSDARLTLRFNGVPGRDSSVEAKIRQGYRLWKDAGRPPQDYRQAKLKFGDGSGGWAWNFLPG